MRLTNSVVVVVVVVINVVVGVVVTKESCITSKRIMIIGYIAFLHTYFCDIYSFGYSFPSFLLFFLFFPFMHEGTGRSF